MLQTFKYLLISLATMLFSVSVFAHAGHDHSHWSSQFLHLIFYASIVAVVAVVSYLIVKRFRKSNVS